MVKRLVSFVGKTPHRQACFPGAFDTPLNASALEPALANLTLQSMQIKHLSILWMALWSLLTLKEVVQGAAAAASSARRAPRVLTPSLVMQCSTWALGRAMGRQLALRVHFKRRSRTKRIPS